MFPAILTGRSLRSITGSVQGYPVLVATSHLESPIPPTNWYSQQRQDQMSECLRHLDAAGVGNVVFAGEEDLLERPAVEFSWL